MPFLGKVPSQIVDSDVDIDGGTIDGATIGSITAGAGTFTNLSATGTITFPDDGISGDDINGGTISNVAISGTTASFTGDLAVDTDTLFVDVSAGRVGIGDNTPNALFHVAGGNEELVRIQGADAQVRISSAATGEIDFDNVAGGGSFTFTTGGSESFRVDDNGRVGIGTGATAPAALLEVRGNNTNARFRGTGSELINVNFSESLSTTELDVRNTGIFNISRQGTPAISVDTFGRVGIGTDDPSRKLHVLGTTQVNATVETSNTRSYMAFVDSNTANSGALIGSNGDDFIVANGPTNSEKFRITSNGNAGIGIVPSDANQSYVSSAYTEAIIQGNSANKIGSLQIRSAGTANVTHFELAAADGLAASYIWNGTASDMVFGTNNSERMRIDANGAIIHKFGTAGARKSEHLYFQDTQNTTATLAITLEDGGTFFIRVGTAHPLYNGTALAWEYFVAHKATNGTVATAQMSKDATSVSFNTSSVTASGGVLRINFPTGSSSAGTSVKSDIFVEITGQYTSVSLD